MYSFFIKYVKSAAFKIFLLAVLGMGASACGVYMAFVSKRVVDVATGQADGSFLFEGLCLACVLVFQLVLQVALSALHVRCAAGLKRSIQATFFENLLHKDRLEVSAFHSGELVNRIAGDVNVVSEGATEVIPSVFSLSARVILSFIALAVLDLPLALMCLALGPVMLIAAKVYRDKTSHLFLESRKTEGEVRSFLQEAFQNLSAIKAFSAFDIITNQLQTRQDKSYRLSVKKNTVGIIANICFFTAMTAGYYVALGWGAYRLQAGAISFGTMTALLTLSGEVTAPFRSIAALFTQYMSVRASVMRLSELENMPSETVLSYENEQSLYNELECISLDGVSFSYGENEVLNKTSAVFEKNVLTAVTGRSGIGKSTVLGLLACLYKPAEGKILLNTKTAAKELTAASCRMFAYVPQDILILSGTIRENITFFAKEVDSDKLEKAVRLSCLSDEIADMPEGLDTVLGENGSRLSGGQRQRIALARALYSNAKILLLDEATSALSQETEEEVIKNIKSEGYTAIVVTHRESVVNMCENILIIKDGKIVKK